MEYLGSIEQFKEDEGQAIAHLNEDEEIEIGDTLDFDNGASIIVAEILKAKVTKKPLNRDNVEKKWYWIWKAKERATTITEKQGYEKTREMESDIIEEIGLENDETKTLHILRW